MNLYSIKIYDIYIRDNINKQWKRKRKREEARKRGRWKRWMEGLEQDARGRNEREGVRRGNRRKHMPWGLVPRRSKAYLASSCSCLTARGTAAAQTALPRAPFFLRSPMRLVAFLDLRGTRHGTGGAHCVLKTSRRPRTPSLRRRVRELLPKSLSPKNPATDCDVRGAGRKVVRLRGGEGGTHFAPGLFFRSACRNANVHDGGDWPFFLFLSLSFYRSLLVPTAIKNLPRDCLSPGATDSYHCTLRWCDQRP